MPKKTVSADDDHTELVNSTEAKEVYESDEHDGFVFEIIQNDVHVGHSKGMIRNERVVRESREGKWYPKGEPLYAAPAGNSDAVVDVRRASFNVEIFAPLTLPNVDTINDILNIGTVEEVLTVGTQQNRASVNSFTFDPSADAMPNQQVPDNFDVLIQASYGNDSASEVTVGSHELGPGDSVSFGVDNLQNLPAIAEGAAGDVVNISHEE